MERFLLEKVPGAYIREAWPKVEAALLACPETWAPMDTLEAIEDELHRGERQLWFVLDHNRTIKLILMTRLVFYPAGPVLRIVWGTGEDSRIAATGIDIMERVAKQVGALRLEIVGRPGWERVFRDYGYRELYRVIGKDLLDSPSDRKDH